MLQNHSSSLASVQANTINHNHRQNRSKSLIAVYSFILLLLCSFGQSANAAWSQKNNGLSTLDIRSFAIDPVTPTTLYAGTWFTGHGIVKSIDGGGNWFDSSTGLPSSSTIDNIAIDPVTPSTLYATESNGGLYKSTDGGASWYSSNSGFSSNNIDIDFITIDSNNPNIIYAGDFYDVYKSTDGGATWNVFNTGSYTGPSLGYRMNLFIDPTTPNTLYVTVMWGGIIKSTDGGANWSVINTGLVSNTPYGGFHINDIAIDPVTPTTLYATSDHNGSVISKSTDGGANWSTMNTGLSGFAATEIEINPITPNTLYVLARGVYVSEGINGVYKSIDGGANWININDGLNNTIVTGMAIDLSTSETIYTYRSGSSDIGGVYKYTSATPAGLSFTDLTEIALNTMITSETLVISGLDVAAVDITITGGKYSLNGAAFTSATGTASNGDTLQLRTTSSADYYTEVNVDITVGDGGDTWSVTTLTDTIPGAFSFINQGGVATNITTTSNTAVITELGASSPVSIANGEYSINGGSFRSSAGFINNNDTVTVRHTSSVHANRATDSVLTIGGISDTFTSTTGAVDTAPSPFNFFDRVDAQLNRLYTSTNSIQVSGINADAPISVTGGEYSIDGGLWTSAPGTVSVLSRVLLRHTSASTGNTMVNTVLTIGGVSSAFSTTTKVIVYDTVPNAFNFYDRTDAKLNTLYNSTNSIGVSGINADAPISITGGEYSIDGGAWTSTTGTVSVFSRVFLRQTSASTGSTQTDAVLTIGGISATFSVTTKATDTTPNQFSFYDRTGAKLNTLYNSTNSIGVSGISAPASISITGGEYSIDGGAWTSTAGTVSAFSRVLLRQTSAATGSTQTDAVLTIGTISATFSVTTKAVVLPDTSPNQFSFYDRTNAQLNRLFNSTNSIQVSGINADAPISVTGGEYSIDGGAWTSASGTVSAFSRVLLRQTSAATNNTQTDTVLTIGGISATFSITTKP